MQDCTRVEATVCVTVEISVVEYPAHVEPQYPNKEKRINW